MLKILLLASTLMITIGHITFDYFVVPNESSLTVLVDIVYMMLCMAQAWTVVCFFHERFQKKLAAREKDALTGAMLRPMLKEKISDEQYRMKREEARFTVIMLDVDYFKTVNDTFGHIAGDAVLKHVVSLFEANLRQLDSIGRWGGEEFIILLPCTELNGGVQVAEKLRRLLIDNPCAWKKHSIPVTASFGVVECSMLDTSIEALIERADDEMYRAKAAGRNRVCSNTMSTFMSLGSTTDSSASGS